MSPSPFEEQKTRIHPPAAAATRPAMADAKEKEFYDHEAYSGLQVVGDGIPQIISREAPELATGLPGYAEHKAFGQHPPPQVSPHQPHSNLPIPVGGGPQPGYDYRYHNGGGSPSDPSVGGPGGKARPPVICGLRRKVFWVVLALVVFALMVAIAVGLGLGLGEANKNSSSASTASASAVATTTLPAATASATASGSTDIICPSANRTLYTLATDTSKKYLVLCGRDYNSDGGATDLTNMNITTFEGCLNECGSLDGCTAVGWGNYYGTYTCWLKSAIGVPNSSPDWYAAVEDDSG